MKNTYHFFLAIVAGLSFLITSCNTNTDPKPDTSGKFIKFFGTSGMSQAYCLSEISDGFILAGYSVRDGRSDKDILVVKTDKNGNRVWEKRWASKFDEYARHLTILKNGQIWIAGTQFDSQGYSQALLLRLNGGGQAVDTLYVGKPEVNEDAYHVSEFPNGDFLIGGVRDTAGERNMYVTRITAEGEPVWVNDIGVIGEDDSLARVLMLDDGNMVWCGTSERGTNKDIRCVKSTSNGGVIWSFEYGDLTKNEFGRDIIATQDGGFVVIGSEGQNGSERLMVLKLNSNGGSNSPKFPIEGNTGGHAISSVSTGGFVATGFTKLSSEDKQLTLLRLDDNLGLQWSKEFGGSRFDEGHAIKEASDGFFTIAGYTDLFQNKNNVFYLVKTDQNGVVNEEKK